MLGGPCILKVQVVSSWWKVSGLLFSPNFGFTFTGCVGGKGCIKVTYIPMVVVNTPVLGFTFAGWKGWVALC